jgi:SAM-dependent methyltransferase
VDFSVFECPLAVGLRLSSFRHRRRADDYDRRVTASRYDDHAAWYVDYTSRWELSSTATLPSDLNGLRVLDLGCGWGQLSRELAGRGAAVTAIDLSGKLLERARDIERRHPVGIRHVHGDATCMAWWDGTAYDGVVCNMAFMDIDDLDAGRDQLMSHMHGRRCAPRACRDTGGFTAPKPGQGRPINGGSDDMVIASPR